MNKTASFQSENYYHIYHRSNNKESIFKKQKHRSQFLGRYKNYISPFVFTHSYALLENHFHFSIQVKSVEEIARVIDAIPKKDRTLVMWKIIDNSESIECHIDSLLINQFKNFLISYAKGVNREMKRTGSLFQKKFKRSVFDSSKSFQKIQYYIHHNARFHEIVHHFTDYPFHSFLEIILGTSSIIDISKVLEHYDNIDEFKHIHTCEFSKAQFENFDFSSLIDNAIPV